MGSSASSAKTVSPEFQAEFRARADGNGAMTFAAFMELALYHPRLGYYRRAGRRVGYGAGTDFFTASTSGPIFGELVAAACATLLGERELGEYTFVEIGAEPERGGPGGPSGGVLAGVRHGFGAVRTVRLGEPIELSGRCVVFSNELFDAQPFSRFVFRGGEWHELGVALRAGELTEVVVGRACEGRLPTEVAEGYVFDAPLAAEALARKIAGERWTGLFVACDYGKSWRELAEATPAGTARAYFRHAQSNDLLARPGEQDLTCHVCWDWLSVALEEGGFREVGVETQEAFFVRHAGDFIAATTAVEAARLSQRKLALMQLLHPAHLGQKFQVLHAVRG
ncbi:MAG: SAM-dependent methyltransferase [Opitutaceae bacterium]